MKSKKAAMSFQLILLIVAIGALGLYFLVLRHSVKQTKTLGGFTLGDDSKCFAQRLSMVPGKKYSDIDGDLRPDFCDWCVCQEGCNNDPAPDGDDHDDDNLPVKCDKNDNDRLIVDFNEQNCDEDHLVPIGGDKKQCRPS